MRSFIFAIFIVFAVGGCATQGVNSFNYTPSKEYPADNEKTIARPQSVVWDELVRELSKSFYVINNIERESRIINVSFTSNSPSDYVDCGRTRRTYTQGDKTETFDYAVAERTTFKFAGNTQPHPSMFSYAVVTRTPTLDGRSNIYVAPDPKNSGNTVVSINTRYIVTTRIRGDAFVQHVNGNIMSRSPVQEETSFIFRVFGKSSG